MHVDTITELLALPNYKVICVIEVTPESLHLEVVPKEYHPPVCSGCLRIHNTSVHSRQEVVVEDLRMGKRRVFLHVLKRKSECLEDNTIRTGYFPELLGRNTRRFAEYVYRLTSITTNPEAGWFLDMDDERVYRIDRAIPEALSRERLQPVSPPSYMSVDEVAWQKWHKYVTNVVDIAQRLVIWNHPGRGKATLDKFYHDVGPEACTQIRAVASDGARGYLQSTREHTEAFIVLENFQVKMSLSDALETIRKEELKKARKEEDGELADILHCNKRFILMQNKVSSKKVNLLETLSRINQRVFGALLLKDQFLSVYTAPDRLAAGRILKEWIVSALRSSLPPFKELALKFFRKRHYILNYYRYRISTAISEGINNKIKRRERMAYGYKDVTYFLLKIHQHSGLLNPTLST